MFILLTGAARSGKTTACWKALPGLRAAGVKIGGFVSPVLLDAAGVKTGIEMWDLSTGEHRTLARVARPGEPSTMGIYRFVEGATAWARDVLAAALLADIDWLVIDEIGPLELHQGGGFAFALEPLADAVRAPNAIVMVRESLADELAERLGRFDMVRVHVTPETRADIPAQLVRLVQAART